MSFQVSNDRTKAARPGRQPVTMHAPTTVAVPQWSKQPTTTLTTANIRYAMERTIEILGMHMAERNLLALLSDRQVVPQGSEFVRMTFAYQGAFEPRPEHGSFPVMTVDETADRITMNSMGLGMRLSIEAIRQDPRRVLMYAYALSERMVEAEMYAILAALLQIEQYRMSLIEDGAYIHMLSSLYRMMAINKIPTNRRNEMVSVASTYLSQSPQNLFLPPNMETSAGSPDGPRVIAVRGGLNPENLRSALEEQLRMGEYFNFVSFMNSHNHTHANSRDIEVFDYARNTRAVLSFLKYAKRAMKKFVEIDLERDELEAKGERSGLTWNMYNWFNKNPRIQQLYGRAKLIAAGLPDKSLNFVFLLALAKDKPSTDTNTVWNYVTKIVNAENNSTIGDKEKRMVRTGEVEWTTMYNNFSKQNPRNSLLGGSVGNMFENVLNLLDNSNWEIDRVAGFIGGYDELLGTGSDNLIDAGVSLPIDLLAIRHKMMFAFSTAIMHTGEPVVTVYTTDPIVAVGDDVTTATAVANIAFSNNGVPKDNAQINVMTIRGAILNRHISGGGVGETDIIPVAVPPGTLMPDIFPLTTDCASKLTGEKELNKYVAAAIGTAASFNIGSMDLTRQLLSESAVRTGCTYKIENGTTVVDVNPNAPAHLIYHLPRLH